MMTLSDTLTVGLVLVLLFGAVALYLYTRIQQAEQKITLLESILLDLKMSSEFRSYSESPADDPKPFGSNELNGATDSPVTGDTYTPFEEEHATSEDVSHHDVEEYKSVVADAVDSSSTSAASIPTASPIETVESVTPVALTESVSDSKSSAKYDSMTLKELQALAKTRGIMGAATMKKGPIIEALKTSDKVHASSLAESGFNGMTSTFLDTSSSFSAVPAVSETA